MSCRGDVRKEMRRLSKLGYDVVRSRRKGHWHVYHDGVLVAVTSGTGSDVRGMRNFEHMLRNRSRLTDA